MAVPKSVITDAELDVLKVLWDHEPEPATARAITALLYEDVNASALGTVQKLITRLEAKKLLKRDRSLIPHQFLATATREDIAGMQLDECAEKLSAGSLSPFVLHLVQNQKLTKAEREEIKRLLDN